MAKFSITYRAPDGDDPVVTTRGVRFFDAQPVIVDDEENADLVAKAKTNRFFEVSQLTVKEAIRADAPKIVFQDSASTERDDERDELIAEARALGVDVDLRWGVARLQKEISKAKIARIED